MPVQPPTPKATPTSADAADAPAIIATGLVVSSAPLGWPDFTVEQRYAPSPGRIEKPKGTAAPEIYVWTGPTTFDIRLGPQTARMDQPVAAMVIAPPGMPMTVTFPAASRFTRIIIARPYLDRIASGLLGLGSYRILPFMGAADFVIAAIARIFIDAATGRQPLDAEMIAGTLRELAIRLLHGHSDQSFALPDAAGKLAPASLARVLDLIGEHLAEPLPVDRLAREAGVSRSHFSRAFTKSVGRTPHAYVMSRRVAKAAHLLRHSTLTLDQIAAACGFHDQAHMSRQFRRRMQTTPGAWRQGSDPGATAAGTAPD